MCCAWLTPLNMASPWSFEMASTVARAEGVQDDRTVTVTAHVFKPQALPRRYNLQSYWNPTRHGSSRPRSSAHDGSSAESSLSHLLFHPSGLTSKQPLFYAWVRRNLCFPPGPSPPFLCDASTHKLVGETCLISSLIFFPIYRLPASLPTPKCP